MTDNNNNNSANIEDLLKLAECPICSELKTDHRILVSCGHSFCLDDLESLVQPNCPMCRTPIIVPQQGIKNLIKDFHKIALVELALKWQTANFGTVGKDVCFECSEEATLWCQEEECGFCNEHAEAGHRIGKAKTHNLVHPSKKIVKVLCPSHKKELEKYCTSCNTVICIDCFIFDHVGHKIGTLESICEDRKKALLEEWKSIADNLSKKLSEDSNVIQEASSSIAKNLLEVEEKTTTYFDQMLNLLQQRKREVLKIIQQKQDERLGLVARQKQILKSLEEIQMQSQALTAMSQKLSAHKWLEMEKSLRQDFSKWSHKSNPLQVEKLEASLPDLKSLIDNVGLISKPQPMAKDSPSSEISFQLNGVAVGTYSDELPRGYEITPIRNLTLTFVLVRLKSFVAGASVVLANSTGNTIQETLLSASQTEWYKAEFNTTLDKGTTYMLLLVRPDNSIRFYCQAGTYESRTIGDTVTIKSVCSKTLVAPFQNSDIIHQMQFRVGVVIQ